MYLVRGHGHDNISRPSKARSRSAITFERVMRIGVRSKKDAEIVKN
jgi:hypothetical protein